MKRYDNIMQDNTLAPKPDNNIWLKDDKLYYFNNGKWNIIGGSSEEDSSLLKSLKQEVEDLINLSTSDAIDNLNEIKDFLAGFKDDEALKDWMNNYYTKTEVDGKFDYIEADKLKTPVTLWGKEFDGSKNISSTEITLHTIFLPSDWSDFKINDRSRGILTWKCQPDSYWTTNFPFKAPNITELENKLEGITKVADDSEVLKGFALNSTIKSINPNANGVISIYANQGISVSVNNPNSFSISPNFNYIASKSSVDDIKQSVDLLISGETANDAFDTLKEVDTWIKSHEEEAAGVISSINSIDEFINPLKTNNRAFVQSTNQPTHNANSVGIPFYLSNFTAPTKMWIIHSNINAATTTTAGVMTSTDKVNLDSVVDKLNDVSKNEQGNLIIEGKGEILAEDVLPNYPNRVNLYTPDEENIDDITFYDLNGEFKVYQGSGIELSKYNGGMMISSTLDTQPWIIVDSLPDTPDEGNENKIHLVYKQSEDEQNTYSEYIWIEEEDKWEKLGEVSLDIDASNFATSERVTAIEAWANTQFIAGGSANCTSEVAGYSFTTKKVNGTAGTNVNLTIPAATTTKAGVMSATDKQMLNSVVEQLREAEYEDKTVIETFNSINDNLIEIYPNTLVRGGIPVNSAVVRLKAIPEEDQDRVVTSSLIIETQSSPAITFETENSVGIVYHDGFTIEPNTTYEISFMWVGTYWIASQAKVNYIMPK